MAILNSFSFCMSLPFFFIILGLELLHEITSARSYVLRIDLQDWENNQRYAEYS